MESEKDWLKTAESLNTLEKTVRSIFNNTFSRADADNLCNVSGTIDNLSTTVFIEKLNDIFPKYFTSYHKVGLFYEFVNINLKEFEIVLIETQFNSLINLRLNSEENHILSTRVIKIPIGKFYNKIVILSEEYNKRLATLKDGYEKYIKLRFANNQLYNIKKPKPVSVYNQFANQLRVIVHDITLVTERFIIVNIEFESFSDIKLELEPILKVKDKDNHIIWVGRKRSIYNDLYSFPESYIGKEVDCYLYELSYQIHKSDEIKTNSFKHYSLFSKSIIKTINNYINIFTIKYYAGPRRNYGEYDNAFEVS